MIYLNIKNIITGNTSRIAVKLEAVNMPLSFILNPFVVIVK